MSEQCEQTSERMSEWPSTLRVDFMPFLLKVQRGQTGGGSGGSNDGSEMKLYEINALII